MAHSLDCYVLGSLLGEGAAGRVYRAVRRTDGQVVAVKILREENAADPTYRRRFQRESRVATAIRSPHLVPVLDAGEHDGLPYLVLAYVEGVSLEVRLRRRGAMTVPHALRLLRAVADGLAAVHRHELVHRDVKPGNVLIDRSGRSLLTDFGLARGAADSLLTGADVVVGTVDYIAPELVRGEPATPATDIYALGCLAHAAITGRPPFAGRSVLRVLHAHAEERPPALSRCGADVSPAVEFVVAACLSKEPAGRPAGAGAVTTMLAAASRQSAPGTSAMRSRAGSPSDWSNE